MTEGPVYHWIGGALPGAGRAIVLAITLLGLPCPMARAQYSVVAEADVDVVVRSARLLRLRVGSPGSTVDMVHFGISGLPGSGAVPGISSGKNPVTVQAMAVSLTGQMVLTVDTSEPLRDNVGNVLRFSEIEWIGSGAIPGGAFEGVATQQIFSSSSKKVIGAMAFRYRHTDYVPAGTYRGRALFTLSAP